MKKIIITSITITTILNASAQMNYPVTQRGDVTDNYFGTEVADPYRWLEDEHSAETKNWVLSQNKITFSYLDRISFRDNIKRRLTELWDYEKNSVPFKEGEYYLSYKNNGKQNQSVLYIQKGLDGTKSVLLDPNSFSADGTTSLSQFSVSHDHKHAAYGISKAGSDWNEFYVIDIPSGKQWDDKLENIKFSSMAWYKDGFFYSRFDNTDGKDLTQKNSFGKLYYHKIGTPQSKDELIYEDKTHPSYMFGAKVTDDEQYLIITVSESTSGNQLYVKKLGKKKAPLIKIVTDFEHTFSVVDVIDGKLMVHTDYKAPKYQVIAIDPNQPDAKNWKTVIPESKELLQSVYLVNNMFMAAYLSDIKSELRTYDFSGKHISDVTLPGMGIVNAFSSKKKESEAFFSFTSFTDPGTIYKYDAKNNSYSEYIKTSCAFDSQNYVTEQVFYPSKDGTQIPMFIIRRKEVELYGKNPCYLYGYGGFNISVTPAFSPNVALFLEQGGIYAVANIRGGGEYGADWHKSGTKLQKQNVFDDFIAAAEYLINNGITTNERLAISGRSNGGLLVGACMTQRPDLFKVALPGVGVLDMLRYHKFTIGYAWAVDYGTSDNKEEFEYLRNYSPVHNVQETQYPATLVFTADHDDRVVPAHSFKFISELQHKQQGENPVLIRIDVNAGHGAGKPLSKTIDEWTDIWAFVMKNLGMEFVKYDRKINHSPQGIEDVISR